MLPKLLNQLSYFLKQSLEENKLTEDALKQELLVFVKNLIFYIIPIQDPNKYNQAFADQQNADSCINKLSTFLLKRIKKWPLSKLFNPKIKVNLDSEGFDTDNQSSEGEIKSPRKPIIQKQLPKEPQQQNNDFEAYRNQVTEFRDRVIKLETQIQQMTTDYLKDIQHLKLTFMRQIENPDHEFVEVNYYDINSGLEPEVRSYIVDKVDFVSKQYQQRLQYCKLQITALQFETDSYKKTIQLILQQHTLPSVVQTLFALEKDFYKIWKQFQDTVGNKLFFQIFEQQSGGYGINYREIDELISKSQASSRLFQRQRTLQDEQIKALIEENKSIIQSQKQEIIEKDTKIKQLELQLIEENTQIKQEMTDIFQQQLKDTLLSQYEEQQRQIKKVQKDLTSKNFTETIQSITMKAALSRWSDYSRFYKLYSETVNQNEINQLQVKIVNMLQSCNVNFIQKDYSRIKQKYQEAQSQIQNLDQDNQYLTKQITRQQYKIQQLTNNSEMLYQTIYNYKQNAQFIESALKIVQRPLFYILQRLGYQIDIKKSLINMRNLNLMQGGIEINEFIMLLKDLPKNEHDEINSTINAFLKGRIAQEIIIDTTPQRNSSTITEIFDIRQALQSEFQVDQIIQQTEPMIILTQNERVISEISKTQKMESLSSPKNFMDEIRSDRIINKTQANNPTNVSKDYSPSFIKQQTQYTTDQIKEEKQANQQMKTSKLLKNTEKPQENFTKLVEKLKEKTRQQQQQQQPQTNRQNRKKSAQQSSDTQTDNYVKSNYQQKTLKPIQLQNTTPISGSKKKMLDKSVQVTNEDLKQNNIKQKRNQKEQKDQKIHFENHQDILVIMTKNQDSPNRSPNITRNKQYRPSVDAKGQQDLSLLQAQKQKYHNRTFYQRDQSPESENSSLLAFNPFQFYQDVFKEKKKIQFKNFTIQQDTSVLQKLIQDRKKFEVSGGIEGKPLSIPPYLK